MSYYTQDVWYSEKQPKTTMSNIDDEDWWCNGMWWHTKTTTNKHTVILFDKSHQDESWSGLHKKKKMNVVVHCTIGLRKCEGVFCRVSPWCANQSKMRHLGPKRVAPGQEQWPSRHDLGFHRQGQHHAVSLPNSCPSMIWLSISWKTQAAWNLGGCVVALHRNSQTLLHHSDWKSGSQSSKTRRKGAPACIQPRVIALLWLF